MEIRVDFSRKKIMIKIVKKFFTFENFNKHEKAFESFKQPVTEK
jgi:hypothetical protein